VLATEPVSFPPGAVYPRVGDRPPGAAQSEWPSARVDASALTGAFIQTVGGGWHRSEAWTPRTIALGAPRCPGLVLEVYVPVEKGRPPSSAQGYPLFLVYNRQLLLPPEVTTSQFLQACPAASAKLWGPNPYPMR